MTKNWQNATKFDLETSLRSNKLMIAKMTEDNRLLRQQNGRLAETILTLQSELELLREAQQERSR